MSTRPNLLAAAVLCVALVGAETPLTRGGLGRTEDACVRVGGCSGTLVWLGDRTVGLCVAHCGAEVGAGVDVYSRHGERMRGRWVLVDERVDLAMFVLVDPAQKSPQNKTYGHGVKPGSSKHVPGTVFRALGYRAGKSLRPKQFSLIGTTTPSNLDVPRSHYSVTEGKFGDGDSGGGVFNEKGELVGVISHGSDGDTEAYSCTTAQLTEFLAGYVRPERLDSDAKMAEAIESLEQQVKLMQARISSLETRLSNKGKDVVTPKLLQKFFADNKETLIGPAGPAGPAGSTGQDGKPGADGTNANVTDINRRLDGLESWTATFKARVRLRLVPRETE